MRFVDEAVVDGRTFQVQVDSLEGEDGFRLVSMVVDGTDDAGVGMRLAVKVPAADLILARDVMVRTMTGLAYLALGTAVRGLSPVKPSHEQVRLRYPKAWTAWTADDDQLLRDRYAAGTDLVELGTELGRRPSALVTRLLHRGVITPEQAQHLLAGLDDDVIANR